MIGRPQQQQHEEGEGVGVGVGVGAEIVTTTTTTQTLIPGLPYDIALLCLAGLPLEAHGRASAVSRAWRRALQSEHMWRLRRTWARTQHLLCLFRDDPALTQPEMLDPSTCTWTRLPLMPCHAQRFGLSNFAAVGLGSSVYVLGGCAFDARAYPPGRPVPCSTLFRFDCRRRGRRWERRHSMRHPRGGFAWAASASASASDEMGDGVIVAAGGATSRHARLPEAAAAAAPRTRAVEVYDVARDEWRPAPDLPAERAGAAAFFLPHPHPPPHAHADAADHSYHRGWDFWIMGGFGSPRSVGGVVSVDLHSTDVAVLSSVSASGDGEGWHRLPPPTWRHDADNANHFSDGLQLRVGRVAVIHGRGGCRDTSAAAAASASRVYALHCWSLYRYDIAYNRWEKESTLPRKIIAEEPYSLVALNDELYAVPSCSYTDYHSTRASTREGITLVFQVYNPKKRSWRLISTKPPIKSPLKFPWAAMCSVEL